MKKIKKTLAKSNKLDKPLQSSVDSGQEPIKNIAEPDPDINKYAYFISPIYHANKAEFLESVKEVADRRFKELEQQHPDLHPIYPLRQTDTILNESSIKSFIDYVGYTSFNALVSEGYDMSKFSVVFQEMWLQEHHKFSAHEEHVHGFGAQMVGFYFLDCPEYSGRLVFHDPRPAKRQINLPEEQFEVVSDASTAVNFDPKPGDLFLAPSWLPHSISRHAGDKPLRFVHITVSVILNDQPNPSAEPVDNNSVVDSTVTII
jgi:hypothetical protein